jgi:hypothetical protein
MLRCYGQVQNLWHADLMACFAKNEAQIDVYVTEIIVKAVNQHVNKLFRLHFEMFELIPSVSSIDTINIIFLCNLPVQIVILKMRKLQTPSLPLGSKCLRLHL